MSYGGQTTVPEFRRKLSMAIATPAGDGITAFVGLEKSTIKRVSAVEVGVEEVKQEFPDASHLASSFLAAGLGR
jgi:hypothetical protein